MSTNETRQDENDRISDDELEAVSGGTGNPSGCIPQPFIFNTEPIIDLGNSTILIPKNNNT